MLPFELRAETRGLFIQKWSRFIQKYPWFIQNRGRFAEIAPMNCRQITTSSLRATYRHHATLQRGIVGTAKRKRSGGEGTNSGSIDDAERTEYSAADRFPFCRQFNTSTVIAFLTLLQVVLTYCIVLEACYDNPEEP